MNKTELENRLEYLKNSSKKINKEIESIQKSLSMNCDASNFLGKWYKLHHESDSCNTLSFFKPTSIEAGDPPYLDIKGMYIHINDGHICIWDDYTKGTMQDKIYSILYDEIKYSPISLVEEHLRTLSKKW